MEETLIRTGFNILKSIALHKAAVPKLAEGYTVGTRRAPQWNKR